MHESIHLSISPHLGLGLRLLPCLFHFSLSLSLSAAQIAPWPDDVNRRMLYSCNIRKQNKSQTKLVALSLPLQIQQGGGRRRMLTAELVPPNHDRSEGGRESSYWLVRSELSWF